MESSIRVVKDQATPTIKKLAKALQGRGGILAAGNSVIALIQARTLAGRSGAGNAPFPSYKTKPYYAPVANRPPGYPAPKGGVLTKSKKSMKYGSYGEYKSKMGLGSKPQLSVSNEMLSDMQFKVVTQKVGYVYFGSRLSQAKAFKHHGGMFAFFMVGAYEYKHPLKAIAKNLKRQVQELKGGAF